MDCEEFAIVGFWNLIKRPADKNGTQEADKYKCTRRFYIPNPMKRMVRSQGETNLYTILYTSHHSKDIFFFYKG